MLLKKIILILAVVSLSTISGCQWFNQAKEDALEVLDDSKASAMETKDKLMEGYADIEDTMDDIKQAAKEVQEAREAIKEIGE